MNTNDAQNGLIEITSDEVLEATVAGLYVATDFPGSDNVQDMRELSDFFASNWITNGIDFGYGPSW